METITESSRRRSETSSKAGKRGKETRRPGRDIESSNESQSIESSQTQSKRSLKEQNQKRVQNLRVSADFIRNLPEGVTYHNPDDESQEGDNLRTFGDIDDDFKEVDIVRAGDFTINIEVVSKAQLISMRKFLPPEQYRLLKNRKTARLCRRKRKEERGETQKVLDELKKDNDRLHAKLGATERLLRESQRALELQQQRFDAQLLSLQASVSSSVGKPKES